MTIQELARQAVEHIKTANGRLHCSDVSDAYLTHLEKQGADHGVSNAIRSRDATTVRLCDGCAFRDGELAVPQQAE